MKKILIVLQCLLIVLGISAFALASASEKGIVVNPNPNFGASIWTDRSEYEIGDPVRIKFRSDVDGYAIIYDYSPDGRSQVIWPRSGAPEKIRGGRTYTIPDGGYEITASEPTGRERLVLVVSRDRAHLSFEYELGRPFWEGARAKLEVVSPREWTSASCSFNVVTDSHPEVHFSGQTHFSFGMGLFSAIFALIGAAVYAIFR